MSDELIKLTRQLKEIVKENTSTHSSGRGYPILCLTSKKLDLLNEVLSILSNKGDKQ